MEYLTSVIWMNVSWEISIYFGWVGIKNIKYDFTCWGLSLPS